MAHTSWATVKLEVFFKGDSTQSGSSCDLESQISGFSWMWHKVSCHWGSILQ